MVFVVPHGGFLEAATINQRKLVLVIFLKLPPFRAHLALRRLCAVPLHEHVGSAFLFRSCCHSLSLQPCRLRVSPRSSFHPLLTLFPSEVLKRSSGASSRTRPLPGLMVPSRSLHPQVFSDRRPISQLVWPPSAPLFPYHVLSSPRCSSFPGLVSYLSHYQIHPTSNSSLQSTLSKVKSSHTFSRNL